MGKTERRQREKGRVWRGVCTCCQHTNIVFEEEEVFMDPSLTTINKHQSK